MKILLKEISKDSAKPTERVFELSRESLNSRLEINEKNLQTYKFDKTANVNVSLYKEGSDIYLKGDVLAEFSSICSRCAESISSSLTQSLFCNFKPQSSKARSGDEEEDLALSYHNGQEVELESYALDQVMLNLPFSILCSEKCQGICPDCGINLNNINCKCKNSESTKSDGKNKPFADLLKLQVDKLH